MEQLKRARGPMRRRITLLCNEMDELLKSNPIDLVKLEAKLQLINKGNEKLQQYDSEIMELQLAEEDEGEDNEENDVDRELAATGEYQMKITEIQIQTERILRPRPVSPAASEYSTASGGRLEKKRQFKLPKIELKKFNGEVTEWLSWWAQFKKIHEDEDLHSSDKFQYLVQGMVEGTRARELVNSYPQTSENYPKVIAALQDRFGKEKLLTQVYVRELLKMVISNAKAKEKSKLPKMFDKLESHLRALESLNVSGDQMSKFLYPMVESSIPEEILIAWQRSAMYEHEGSTEQPPKTELDYLMQFLKKEVEREEQRSFAKAGFEVYPEGKKETARVHVNRKDDIPTAASLYSGQENGCIFCGKPNHMSQDCFRAIKMSLEERKSKIKDTRSCFVCLRKGHPAKNCKSAVRCCLCSQKHYPLMCSESTTNKKTQSSRKGVEGETEEVNVQGMVVTPPTLSNSLCNRSVMMKTLVLHVIGANGQKAKARLLFDEGSQRSYVRTELVKKLGCQVLGKLALRNNLFGGHLTSVKSRENFRVTVQAINSKFRKDLQLINEDIICNACPSIPHGPWTTELHQKKIHLTDVGSDSTAVDILIGSDLWGQLMTGRMVKLKSGLIAVESIFGWTLSGPLPKEESSAATLTISMLTYEDKSLSQLWSLESIGIKDSTEMISKEEHDLKVMEDFKGSISRDSSGRYVVPLPWTSESQQVPSNRIVAEKRLISTTKKLKDQNEYDNYDNIFRNWEAEGMIERVHVEIKDGHFLPHRPVFKPESLTTPVRPVFDASCRVGKNLSLNQCLEKGPNLLELIPAILLRFREKKVGAVADIRKAFQMIGVAEEDRNYQSFLWWEDKDLKKLKVYRHCRVVFGMNCSPFILAAVLNHHLDLYSKEERPTVEALKKALYVDNVVVSLDTKEEYEEFRKKATEVFADAKMDLRLWESNCESPREGEATTNVLGMKWNKMEDTLAVHVPKKLDEEMTVTKRSVLSMVAQVFDPLGFVCPVLLQPKVMLQDSWAQDLGWDEEWKEPEAAVFRKWFKELSELDKVIIPRYAFGGNSRGRLEIHTFTDASKDAYAAAVFARVEDGTEVHVKLLLAKARVSPLDKKKKNRVTIPRLELLGCLIGARLSQSVVQALDCGEVPMYFWSDSTTALAWIKSEQDWRPFVNNRVKEIRKLTAAKDWRHVPGQMNPADLPSRGCLPSELVSSNWWEGPEWLKNKGNWPTSQPQPDQIAVHAEKVTTEKAMAAIEVKEPRFSSFLKNVSVAAWIRRFIGNSRSKKEDRVHVNFPTAREMRQGQRDIWYQTQKLHQLEKSVPQNLKVEMKEDGLLHVKTRLTYREDLQPFKCPILLPKDDPLVHQLIEYVHQNHCHAGAQFVLGKLREEFWIPSGRKTISRIIHKCVTCRRFSSKSLQSEPAPLPQPRVEARFAFQTTGVDLAGPLLLKGGKKAWIVLYTCAVYRGVYLDIVDSLSSEEFLNSLEKFTLTVGRPSTLYSDNGTNFVGAQNLLKKVNWKKLEAKVHVNQIKWTFNPPSAPWWGGWWERLVRTVKELLRRMIGSAKLTRKELESCLASISYTINNRPLTTLTEDLEDLTPLTPAMFMKDLPVAGLPELESIGSQDLQQAFKKIVDLKKALSERFRKEYLALLVEKKNQKSCPSPGVGDIVLVGQENKKRYEWPLGRILELFPGKDNKVRVAKVKTTRGILIRPVQRLYPLEVRNPQSFKTEELAKQDVSVGEGNQTEETPTTIRTRSGREVRKVSRYGKWNN